jgi:hypothetical protein
MDLRSYLAARRDVRPQDVERILEVAAALHNDARARVGLPPATDSAEDTQEPRFVEEAIWHVRNERVDDAQVAPVSAQDRLLDERIAVEMRRMEERRENTSGLSNAMLGLSGVIAICLVFALLAAGAVRGARSDVAEAVASRDAARAERDALVRRAINLARSAQDEGAALTPTLEQVDAARGPDRVAHARAILNALPEALDRLPAEESRLAARRFLRAEATSTANALDGAVQDVATRQVEVETLYWRPLSAPHLWLGAVDDGADWGPASDAR